MDLHKDDEHSSYTSLPVPTYEEAVSRSSSNSFLGPTHISQDAERQELLSSHGRYRPPTVESARSSLDYSNDEEELLRGSLQSPHREISQMNIQDPSNGMTGPRASRISKRITSLTQSLSSIHLPLQSLRPYFVYIRDRSPRVAEWIKPNWILLGRLFALLLVLMVFYLLFFLNVGRTKSRGMSSFLEAENIRQYVQDHINTTYIRHNLQHITSFNHMAGTEGSYVLAKWVENAFRMSSIEDVHLERFDVYVNYPRKGGRRVAIVEPEELRWEAILEEEIVHEELSREQTPVFHGLSKSGTVRGPLIYANYGSRQDFEKLQNQGINTTGSVILARYYGSQSDRALKVKAAQLAGAVGCIIYSDPADNGPKEQKPFPRGPLMPRDGVQRGTVGLTSWVVGDVLSSGFASLPGEPQRDAKKESLGLSQIPSIPLSARDAERLLYVLKGQGRRADKDWIGGLDTEYWIGDQNSPKVELANEQDEEERQPIYNVLGSIRGVEQPEKKVVVGNHRDAWCFGAADPGSGTAVFIEVIRILGELATMGWRPLRTIEFASWDGEEYNLFGSTEHVENQIFDLRRDGVAYLNVDVAVSGSKFRASAVPSFEKALLRVLERVVDPVSNQTMRHEWATQGTKIGSLGAGSDYVGFQDLAGTSSIDIGFEGDGYPYHSCYDGFDWMNNFGDPKYLYHTTLAQIWTLLILEMADAPLLPFDFEAYAREVQIYVAELIDFAQDKVPKSKALKFESLHYAAQRFSENAKEFEAWNEAWRQIVYGEGLFESNVLAIKRMSHNTRMTNFESNLLDVDGGVSSSRAQPAITDADIGPRSFPVVNNSSTSFSPLLYGRATTVRPSPVYVTPSMTMNGHWRKNSWIKPPVFYLMPVKGLITEGSRGLFCSQRHLLSYRCEFWSVQLGFTAIWHWEKGDQG